MRTIRILSCLAVAIAALFGAHTVHTPRVPDGPADGQPVRAHSETQVRPTLLGGGAPAVQPDAPEVATPPSPRSVRVRVIGEDGDPTPGASVAIYSPEPASLDAGDVPEDTRVAAGTTDANGSLTLSFERKTATARLVAMAAATGQKGSREFEEQEEDIEIALDAGLQLSGTLLNASGTPVAGVRLEARHCGLGRRTSNTARDERPLVARSVAYAVSGDAGEFEFHGLVSGWYDIAPMSSDWAVDRRRSRPRVKAGTAHAKITVYGLRIAKIQLVDAESLAPISSVIRSAHLLFKPQLGSTDGQFEGDFTHADVYAAGSWMTIGSMSSPSGVISAPVFLPAPNAPLPKTHLLVQADGYKDAYASVTLFTADEVLSGKVDVVSLPRSGDSEMSGQAVVNIEWNAVDGFKPGNDTRIILNERKVFHGRRISDTKWAFERLPLGEFRALMDDGLGHSLPLTISIDEDGAEASAIFERKSGVRIDIVDNHGKRMFDVERISVRGETQAGVRVAHQVHRGSRTSVDRADAVSPDLTHVIPPGRYTVRARKHGYVTGSREFEIVEGRVTVVRVILEPK